MHLTPTPRLNGFERWTKILETIHVLHGEGIKAVVNRTWTWVIKYYVVGWILNNALSWIFWVIYENYITLCCHSHCIKSFIAKLDSHKDKDCINCKMNNVLFFPVMAVGGYSIVVFAILVASSRCQYQQVDIAPGEGTNPQGSSTAYTRSVSTRAQGLHPSPPTCYKSYPQQNCWYFGLLKWTKCIPVYWCINVTEAICQKMNPHYP